MNCGIREDGDKLSVSVTTRNLLTAVLIKMDSQQVMRMRTGFKFWHKYVFPSADFSLKCN